MHPRTAADPRPDSPMFTEALHSPVPLEVAVLYDGKAAGRRALALVKRMMVDDVEPVHVNPVLWRFDLLEDQACFARAATETKTADMLVLATDRPDLVPAVVEQWVADFLATRRGRAVPILVLWGAEGTGTVSLLERDAAGRMQSLDTPAWAQPSDSLNRLEAAVAA
jgi:hypothetical protein